MAETVRALLLAAAISGLAALPAGASASTAATVVYNPPLTVCADPNNMPFSNRQGQGFENKLAQMVAADFGTTVSYYWAAQRRGFVREGLGAGNCDVIMGTALVDGLDMTRRYYQSSYVFVSRADRHLTFDTMTAPELKHLKVGVALIGDDGANTPPAAVLAHEGIIDNVVGYPVYGDYRNANPPSDIVKAVARGDIDVAAVWGPTAGYFARQSPVPLRVVPITDTAQFFPQVFSFSIGMGIRPGDEELRARLNGFIAKHQAEIDQLLASYGVPEVSDAQD